MESTEMWNISYRKYYPCAYATVTCANPFQWRNLYGESESATVAAATIFFHIRTLRDNHASYTALLFPCPYLTGVLCATEGQGFQRLGRTLNVGSLLPAPIPAVPTKIGNCASQATYSGEWQPSLTISGQTPTPQGFHRNLTSALLIPAFAPFEN